MWPFSLSTNPTDLAPLYQQLGVGALVAVLLSIAVYALWHKNSELQKEITRLQDLRISDGQEAQRQQLAVIERVTSTMASSAQVIESLPKEVQRTLSDASKSVQVDQLANELRTAIAQLRERGGG